MDKMLMEKSGPVGRIIFNNPERHNALSLSMWVATADILHDLIDDDAIRVIVVTGAGGQAFVSGADISKFEDERATAEAVRHYNTVTGQVYDLLAQAPKPTIAMIRGHCIGGGLSLALCCDLRLCNESARFGLPAARLGLGYPVEGLQRLLSVVGPTFATELCFTARTVSAADAARIGLVNRVLADDALEGAVEDYAQTIADNAPLTVTAMKRMFGEIAKDPQHRDLDLCRELVERCFASQDYIEGRQAFVEKRKPSFRGR